MRLLERGEVAPLGSVPRGLVGVALVGPSPAKFAKAAEESRPGPFDGAGLPGAELEYELGPPLLSAADILLDDMAVLAYEVEGERVR